MNIQLTSQIDTHGDLHRGEFRGLSSQGWPVGVSLMLGRSSQACEQSLLFLLV